MFSGSRPAQTLQPRLRNDFWPEHSECRHLPPTEQKMVDSDLQFFQKSENQEGKNDWNTHDLSELSKKYF